jgi:prepilin-type N-terminal cleavage/methylation domain-containing protein
MVAVNRRRSRSERGFTLLEVTVALGMLAVGLLAVSAAQLYAMRGASTGRHTTDAAEIVQDQVEAFQRMTWNDITTDPALAATGGAWVPGGGQQVDRTVDTNAVQMVEQSYSLQWRIQDTVSATGVFLKTIDVRVQWNEPNRPNRSYTITTMRHRDAES